MSEQTPEIERQTMQVDIACVGFGPAMCGFLTTLSRLLVHEDGTPVAESKAMPGLPPQVICYERADDVGFGVSGVVTKGRAIRNSYLHLDLSEIPMAAPVQEEKLVYLLDPVGASRRSTLLRLAEKAIPLLGRAAGYRKELCAAELPWTPEFMSKEEGMVLSMGQFTQWVASQVMSTGLVQVWPSMPVAAPLLDGNKVLGVRLADQGVNRKGEPDMGFMPGMDIRADLTVVADGPVGPVSRAIDERLGMPAGRHVRDWAVGMKAVVDLPEGCGLQPGTVLHTIGYPEPEIFGFLYVYPNNVACMGIFVPSWFDNPVRTAYRYLQHWMQHPYLWRYLSGGTLRSWGAKSLQESGRQGEPFLAGDGYARIGECSGSTNVLTGSGVDEAWATGKHLGESVIELLKCCKPFTRENLEETYVRRRRASWVEAEAKIAEHARDGFQHGFVPGMVGMALAGFTKGRLRWPARIKRPQDRLPTIEEYYRGRIPGDEIQAIREQCRAKGASLHDALMDRAGWPAVEPDGKLLVSHQDALLLGGKVQAPAGYADHVRFADPTVCESCYTKVCIEACSGQAITTNPEGGVPLFDREKCVHCGACLWNCSKSRPDDEERTNVLFSAGAGGLHSAEN
ncbi:MAG: 4Fe-4S ferredoxin [Desulfovibrionaceae bacterium]|jgi:electron-transferring-flavoprotein dehydrogenase|nr:4Fe-4S ferredoxin [Desulfovibrionaceae bacterium]